MNTCPFCGVVTQPGNHFCWNCGHRLQRASPSASESARLMASGENGKDELSYPLEQPRVSIGRAASCDLILTKDQLTSLHHATLSYENGRYVLCDEHSANGTRVNGEQIEAGTPCVLQDGNQIRIGDHLFIFRLSQ